MAIDSKTISTDLTLEIDEEDITAAEFGVVWDHFLGLVKEVTKAIAPRRQPVWLVRIYPGSAGIGFYPRAGAMPADELAQVRQAVLSGIEILDRGQRPVHYTDKAISHARSISAAFKSRGRQARVRVWNRNERSVPVKASVESTAAKILEPVHEDAGSIEGTLEVLSGHGKFEVVVYDPLDNRAIKCEVGEENIQLALSLFMRRVEIFGRIRYRSDGVPVSVKVETIEALPDKAAIPALEIVRGILRD